MSGTARGAAGCVVRTMPCRVYTTEEERLELELQTERSERKRERDELTDLLCRLCHRVLEHKDGWVHNLVLTDHAISGWYARHKEQDDKRQLVELRESGLAKLTQKEKKALGLR